MVKFDPEGFAAMMKRLKAEELEKERQAAEMSSTFEDFEPDYEFLPRRP
jgi:hypothetical protein